MDYDAILCEEHKWWRVILVPDDENPEWDQYRLQYRILYRSNFLGYEFGDLFEKWVSVEWMYVPDDNGDVIRLLFEQRRRNRLYDIKVKNRRRYPCESM